MNIFNGIGRIGRDAVVRQAGGKSVTAWALAIDSGYGERKQTIWMDCSLWGERGERLAEYIRKGDRLGVTGELGTREHEGKTYVTLNVRDVTLLTPKDQRQEQATRQAARQAAPPAQRPQREQPPRGGGSDFEDDDIPF